MTEHTPGPWNEAKTGNHQRLIIAEDTGETIAVSYEKENAPILTAAPEMLEALKDIREYVQGIDGIRKLTLREKALITDLNAAIAKAEGADK